MIKSRSKFAFVAPFVALSIFLTGSIALGESDDVETIRGIVTTADWDDEDNVTAVAIAVTVVYENEDEEEETVTEEYLVADNEKGRELLELVGEEVEVIGNVSTDEDGSLTIVVTAYKVIAEDPES